MVWSTKMAEERLCGAAALASQQLAAIGRVRRSCCCRKREEYDWVQPPIAYGGWILVVTAGYRGMV